MSDGNVIQFRSGRTGVETTDGLLTCPGCGSAWFNLGSTDGGEFHHGAACLNPEGSVTGYSGTPHCMHCGREVLP
jgi:hypothetical protein